MSLPDHVGFCGHFDRTSVAGQLLYYSHYNYEACFYIPTTPLKGKDDTHAVDLDPLALLGRADVLVVWNACQQKYTPGTVLWDTTYALPAPTSRVYILIDPLGNDLFSVRLHHDASMLFKGQQGKASGPTTSTPAASSNSDGDSYIDEGEVFCARTLGPLQVCDTMSILCDGWMDSHYEC